MPIIKSAIKKLRQDEKRKYDNSKTEEIYKKAVRVARNTPSAKNLQQAYSAIDTAAKKHVIHPNKAARLKSRLTQKIKDQKPKIKTTN